MKKSILILLVSTFILSMALQAQNLPYKAEYSSNFKMGSHDLSKMILELYKDYEGNVFSKDAWFADTVIAQLPDGQIIRGKAEVINTFKKGRESDGNTTFTMDAIIPLISVDRNENWVALWGSTETSQGKIDFQSIWRVNKDKKVDFVRFFNSAPAKQQ